MKSQQFGPTTFLSGQRGCPAAVRLEGGHQAEEAGGGLRHGHLLLRPLVRQRSVPRLAGPNTNPCPCCGKVAQLLKVERPSKGPTGMVQLHWCGFESRPRHKMVENPSCPVLRMKTAVWEKMEQEKHARQKNNIFCESN